MISAVNSYNQVVQTKPIQFKGEQIQAEPTKNEGMSTTTKALLGLGALAAIIAGGLLLKKRVDANDVKNLAKGGLTSADDLQKSVVNLEELNEKSLKTIVRTCAPDLKSGDKLHFIPSCKFGELSEFNNLEGFAHIDYTRFPENSFIAFVQRDDKALPPRLFTYANVKESEVSKILEAFANKQIYVKI